jgi:hypothetical protein
VDFAVLIQTAAPDFDWDRVAAVADEFACTTVVAVALRHAVRLGADAPSELLGLPANRYRRAALLPLIEESWPVRQYELGEERRLRYALCDARLRQAQVFVGDVTEYGPWQTPGRFLMSLWYALHRWVRWRKADLPSDGDRLVAPRR